VTGEAQDQASVRITSADGQRTWNWPVTRSGDVWQVVLPVQSGNLSFLNAPLFQQGIADAVERLESIRADVVQGRIADADEAAAAIDEAVEAVNANFR
jgi:FixJ family two-component response regulator